MAKKEITVRIIDEPKTQMYYMLADKPVELRRSFTCPHCDEKTDVTSKVCLQVFNVKTGKFEILTLPTAQAQAVLTRAYNTLLQRITRSMNTKGFGAKFKALFTKKVITFPNPSNTIWTIKYDEGTDYRNLEVSAEVKEKA